MLYVHYCIYSCCRPYYSQLLNCRPTLWLYFRHLFYRLFTFFDLTDLILCLSARNVGLHYTWHDDYGFLIQDRLPETPMQPWLLEQEGWLSPTERAPVSAISLRHIIWLPHESHAGMSLPSADAATLHRATLNRATVKRRQFTGRQLTAATINRSDR